MAHELTQANGRWEFAYAGEAPWHGLGQRLPGTATAQDIIQAAGLDWMILSEPIFLAGEVAIPGHVANVRSDTREVLGVVSDEYHTFQNGEMLAFGDSLVGESCAMYHTAGSLRRGRRVFATAKLPASLVVVPDDVVDQYLLLVTGHDGTQSFTIRFTPVRVVCANTLGIALRNAAAYEYTVTHKGTLAQQLATVRQALGVGVRYFDAAGIRFRALSSTSLTTLGFTQFLNGFLPVMTVDSSSPESAIRARERAIVARDRVTALFEGGLGTDIPGVRGTAWGAFNAGVEWSERVRATRKDGELREGAKEAIVLGTGQEWRQRAFDAAFALVQK